MWRLTRGNVMFLRQLVTQETHAGRLISRDGLWQWVGTMEVSQSLVDLVDQRIGATPEPILEVIDLVAVAEPLELAHLTALADATAIEDAERRGLITVSGTAPATCTPGSSPLRRSATRAGRASAPGAFARTYRPEDVISNKTGAPDPVRLAMLWLQSDLTPDHDVFTRAAQAAFRRLDIALAQRISKAAVDAGAGVDAELLCANTLTVLSRGAEAEALLKSLTARPYPSRPGRPRWMCAPSTCSGHLVSPSDLGRS